jgi:hypothetical protein
MIISDQHRFVFVHIPKCAGVSVKRALRPIDDSEGGFSRIGEHPVLGRIHFAHIPLDDLADNFPDVYAKFDRYRSVAIVRDPADRFISAIFQRLREFKGLQQSQITPEVVETEVRHVMGHLTSEPGRLSLEYVHFNRQSDYIFRDGARVVKSVFALRHMERAAEFIDACTGIRIVNERLNRSTELRVGALRPFVRRLRGPYNRFVPLPMRQKLRAKLQRAGIYGDIEKQRYIQPDGPICRFLRDYYQDDYHVFAECCRNEGAVHS